MQAKTYTVRAGNPAKCSLCRGRLSEGEQAVAITYDGGCEQRHVECPKLAPKVWGESTHVQGAER